MKGMSERVSKTFSHFDFPRVISHAIGIPVTTSRAETSKAIVKEFSMALNARAMSLGCCRISCIAFHLIIIPRIGGNNINAKNTITAVKYTPTFNAGFDESLSKTSVILVLDNVFRLDFGLQL